LEGNLREHELISDRPCIARINSREYRNNVLNPAESAKEHSLKTFCKEIAHFLDGERIAGHYEELVLVAEPHTLGIMRASLNIKVKKLVSGSIEKDFGWIDNKEVSSRVLDYI
jgi:protein required for attachment to host cells